MGRGCSAQTDAEVRFRDARPSEVLGFASVKSIIAGSISDSRRFFPHIEDIQ